MISRILFTLVLACGLTSVAQTKMTSSCNYSLQGGDYFPWSRVASFPWESIQGVWQLSSQMNVFLKARVINATSKRKILNVSLVSGNRCAKPIAVGTGFIDSSEKNVLRAILFDGTYTYQIKLGLFDSKVLKVDSNKCGEKILAATVTVIGIKPDGADTSSPTGKIEGPIHNMMLKKISDDITAICKKPAKTE